MPTTPGASSTKARRSATPPTTLRPPILARCRRCDTAGVRLVDQLRSFRRRRIAIPVRADDLVLDVGSGDKPHWRADVLLDRFIDATHAGQRSGRKAARVSRPLFDADATAMPFADRAFDYSVCSHVLEHVVDPGRGDRRVDAGVEGRLHRGAGSLERQDPRLPEPSVVGPARRQHAGVHRQDGAISRRRDRRLHPAGRHRATPGRPARRRLRPPHRVAALGGDGQVPRRGRGAAVADRLRHRGRRPPARRPDRSPPA